MACNQWTTPPHCRITFAASHQSHYAYGFRISYCPPSFSLAFVSTFPLSFHVGGSTAFLRSHSSMQPRSICIISTNSTTTMAGHKRNGQDMNRTSPPPFHSSFHSLSPLHANSFISALLCFASLLPLHLKAPIQPQPQQQADRQHPFPNQPYSPHP